MEGVALLSCSMPPVSVHPHRHCSGGGVPGAGAAVFPWPFNHWPLALWPWLSRPRSYPGSEYRRPFTLRVKEGFRGVILPSKLWGINLRAYRAQGFRPDNVLPLGCKQARVYRRGCKTPITQIWRWFQPGIHIAGITFGIPLAHGKPHKGFRGTLWEPGFQKEKAPHRGRTNFYYPREI